MRRFCPQVGAGRFTANEVAPSDSKATEAPVLPGAARGEISRDDWEKTHIFCFFKRLRQFWEELELAMLFPGKEGEGLGPRFLSLTTVSHGRPADRANEVKRSGRKVGNCQQINSVDCRPVQLTNCACFLRDSRGGGRLFISFEGPRLRIYNLGVLTRHRTALITLRKGHLLISSGGARLFLLAGGRNMAKCKISVTAVEIDDWDSLISVWMDYVTSSREADADSSVHVYRGVLSEAQFRTTPETVFAEMGRSEDSDEWLEHLYTLEDPRI